MYRWRWKLSPSSPPEGRKSLPPINPTKDDCYWYRLCLKMVTSGKKGMMQNDLFRHGNGDPLVRDPLGKESLYSSLQSLNPAKTRAPQHPALSISTLEWGILQGLGGPKPSTAPLKQGPLLPATVKKTYTLTQSPLRENTLRPLETPCTLHSPLPKSPDPH